MAAEDKSLPESRGDEDAREEAAEAAAPTRKVAVTRRRKQDAADDRAKEHLLDFANLAVSVTESAFKGRDSKPPAYLKAFSTYRDLVERAATVAAFRPSIQGTFDAFHDDIARKEGEISGNWMSKAQEPIRWEIQPASGDRARYAKFFLDLSKGFRNALRVSETAGEGKPDFTLPEQYLLRLYCVFRDLCADGGEDAQTIDEIVADLRAQVNPTTQISSVIRSIDPDNLRPLVGMAVEIMRQTGIEMGDVNADAVADKIAVVTQSAAVGQLFDSVSRDLRGCKSPKDVVGALAKHAAPGTSSEIAQVMGQLKSDLKQGPPIVSPPEPKKP